MIGSFLLFFIGIPILFIAFAIWFMQLKKPVLIALIGVIICYYYAAKYGSKAAGFIVISSLGIIPLINQYLRGKIKSRFAIGVGIVIWLVVLIVICIKANFRA